MQIKDKRLTDFLGCIVILEILINLILRLVSIAPVLAWFFNLITPEITITILAGVILITLVLDIGLVILLVLGAIYNSYYTPSNK